MRHPVSKKSRDVGLAEHRYVSQDQLAYRQKLAGHMREIAAMNESDWILPGYDEIDRKRLALRRQANRLEICGLRYAITVCGQCYQPLLGPQRCECRICDSCAKKYAGRVWHRMADLAKTLQPKDGKQLMLLTLTKKTHPLYWPTSSEARLLFRQARKLINKLYPKRDGCGAFAVMEVGSNHNLHIHALVYGRFVYQEAISALWLKLTGDSDIVHIEAARNPKQGVSYLLKYVTKPKKDADTKELARYLNLLIGVRRIHTYGVFYNYSLLKKAGTRCPLCNGKLRLSGFDPGPYVPVNALFFEEALKMAKTSVN